jgi:ubiquinone/menaquinone biosynthesis C-methylase UbiE
MKQAGANNDQARVAWAEQALKRLPPGLKLLGAGAGELSLKQYCKHLNYVSQDFCQYEGKGDGQALQTGNWDTTRINVVSDITAMPLGDAIFDVLLCSEVLEHVPAPLAAMREFARILKRGGTLLLTVPFCSLTHFAPCHFSGLNRYLYEPHLPALLFAVEELTPNRNWFEFLGRELSRVRFAGRTFSSGWMKTLFLALAYPMRWLLARMSQADRGSDQLLCFGFHVRATRTSG